MSQPDSSLTRMLAILDAFSAERFEWTVEDLADHFDYTTSSTYRYVGELCRAGLLTRIPGAAYVIGAKIIELEALVRDSDPITRLAMPSLTALALQTSCGALISSVYGEHLINVAYARGQDPIQITYDRGHPLPWFEGAPGKAAVAFMSPSKAQKLYAQAYGEADSDGTLWAKQRTELRTITKQGYCISVGELDAGVVGFGVPIIPEDEVIGSISLVCSEQRADMLNHGKVVEMLRRHGEQLSQAIAQLRRQGNTEQISQD